MSNQTPVRFGILGLGSIAKDFAKTMQAAGVPVYAAASRSLEKAKAFANEYAIKKAYGSYKEMLADSDVDAVYIASPHSCHYEHIMKCLRHGKHVLCEKAITVNGAQLAKAVALAKENGLVLCEAMTLYHMPLYQKIKELIQGGSIGKLKLIHLTMESTFPYDPHNRYFDPELAGGALLDRGVYGLSFVEWFFSSYPGQILSAMTPAATGVDEQASVLLQNGQGEIATVSMAMQGNAPNLAVLGGETGYISVDHFYGRACRAVLTRMNGSTEIIEAGEPSKALFYEAMDMQRYIREGGHEEMLGHSLHVMRMMDTLRQEWGVSYPCESL